MNTNDSSVFDAHDLPPLIGLYGKARSGKDTIAGFLGEEAGYTRVAIADAMRSASLALDPLMAVTEPVDRPTLRQRLRMIVSHERPERVRHVRLSELVAARGWDDAKTVPEVRRTLQRMGTEAGLAIHGDHLWYAALERTIAALPLEMRSRVVVSDVRTPLDQKWLNAAGGVLWGIERPGQAPLTGAQGAHPTETSVCHPDLTIRNDGTLEQLRERTLEALRHTATHPPNHALTVLVPELPDGPTPDEINEQLDRALTGQGDLDPRDNISDAIDDVTYSYELAMRSTGVIPITLRHEIYSTVADYRTNSLEL